ncbi:hypothetical protein DLAC_04087 [Tieghemostelium lacteum]|uniref:Uncharacterized protein n=1 Tax=Tieghemostelium lacteum TaxID=361077 RepID=A0A151ZS76_TIELA|nr:hypothetical protein DLAC_04087 [Tieghemostelium lacteum]|eukprot:KYQ96788.1 hypothetical protein DLAC_04087 [Tieghemostelium lacteum]
MNQSWIECIKSNIDGCTSLYHSLRTTLGPYGRDKLIVDQSHRHLTTNDGATILQYLNLKNPTARLLIGISKSQDTTIGDGTSSVILLTYILLQNSYKYMIMSIHPMIFIKGYQIALQQCIDIINSLSIKFNLTDQLFDDTKFLEYLYSIASTSISSKILGRYIEHFSVLGVETIKKLKFNENQDLIRVLSIRGTSMKDSRVIDGVLLELLDDNKSKPLPNNPKVVIGKLELSQQQYQFPNCKILFSSNENTSSAISDSQYYQKKLDILLKYGVNIVISDNELPDILESLFEQNSIFYFKVTDSRELEVLSYCLGTQFLYDLSSIDDTKISKPKQQKLMSIGDRFFLHLSGIDNSQSATVILRTTTDTQGQEAIRSFKDLLNILSITVRNPNIIAGGGCLYIELAKRLRLYSQDISNDKLKISLNVFADSLEVIPLILIQNAGFQNSLELIEKLKSTHQSNENHWKGINLHSGQITDMFEQLKILEPSLLLINILTLSSRAAQMILRINNKVIIEPRSQFKPPNTL